MCWSVNLSYAGTPSALSGIVRSVSPAAPSTELLDTLRAHERLAKGTLLTFAVLTLAQGLLQALAYLFKRRPSRGVVLVLQLAWLLASAGAAVALLRTAHLGGRLVHELDIHGQTRH